MLKITSSSRTRSLSLIFIGFFLVFVAGGFGVLRSYQSKILSFNKTPKQETVFVDENKLPTKIKISKIGIEKHVEKNSIVNGVWEISRSNVSFLDISSVPGMGGNTVIYGHNKNSIFGPIRWLEVGDEIELTNKQGEVFKYKVESIHVVDPGDISFVEPKNEETLTLYTCTGFADTKRHIIIAKP